MDTFEDQDVVYHYLAGAMAWVETTTQTGDTSLGSAFHVGEGVFATARHVVEGGVRALGTTHRSALGARSPIYGAYRHFPGIAWDEPGEATVDDVLFHPSDDIDVALIRTHGLDVPSVTLDPYVSANSVLSTVMLLGYPRIPLGPETPVLVAATGQVNAAIELLDKQPTLILSSVARAGLSGGLVANHYGGAIGLITRSLVLNEGPVEAGYLAALQIDAVCDCVRAHGIDANINLV